MRRSYTYETLGFSRAWSGRAASGLRRITSTFSIETPRPKVNGTDIPGPRPAGRNAKAIRRVERSDGSDMTMFHDPNTVAAFNRVFRKEIQKLTDDLGLAAIDESRASTKH